jgi:hypothetical protein
VKRVLLYVAVLLTGAAVLAQPKDKVVGGEVVALSRSTIIPNWKPTADAVPRFLKAGCYPTAKEAAVQLEYFYKILEIARAKVPSDDPIATGQPARKAEMEKLRAMVSAAPKVNSGCPEQPIK